MSERESTDVLQWRQSVLMLPYCNPPQPDDGGSQQQPREPCQFFVKTGVCRFGLKCSRHHERPRVSDTLVFVNMFQSGFLSSLSGRKTPRFPIDRSVDHEFDEDHEDIRGDESEKRLLRDFYDFFEDVEKELRSFGSLVTVRVCRNSMPHLRGNVYVQYQNINDAFYAMSQLNGRFFAGRILEGYFVRLDDWRVSICGLYHRGRCPKMDSCNFLHPFLNLREDQSAFFYFLNHPFRKPRRSYKAHKDSDTSPSLYGGSTPERSPSVGTSSPGVSRSFAASRQSAKESERRRRSSRSKHKMKKRNRSRQGSRDPRKSSSGSVQHHNRSSSRSNKRVKSGRKSDRRDKRSREKSSKRSRSSSRSRKHSKSHKLSRC